MTSNTKCFVVFLSFILSISGCATVGTFQKMSPRERADYVCTEDSDYIKFGNAESGFQSRIDEISDVLSKGYRVHKSCRNVKVEKPGTISCESRVVYGTRYTDCTPTTVTSYEEVCTETPVPIDANLEKEKLKKYRDLWATAMTEKYTSYRRCFLLVEPMSAEQAFRYYQSR